MKRVVLGAVLLLAACEDMPMTTTSGLGTSGGGGRAEFLVVGSRMTFEECRARGGLIIRDQGSPMVMCDPNVIGAPVPPDEFDHPQSQAAAAAAAANG